MSFFIACFLLPRPAAFVASKVGRSFSIHHSPQNKFAFNRRASPNRYLAPVETDVDREQQVLARCRAQEACPVVAQNLLDIVAKGAGRSGRARVGLIIRAGLPNDSNQVPICKTVL
jgi:hypothetical protein